MGAFLEWLFQFLSSMFSNIWSGLISFIKGIIGIFDFKTYFGLFSSHQDGFGVIGWIFAIFCFILVYAFWAGLVILIVLGVKKYLRFRATVVQNDDLLEEISNLHKDVDRLIKEKEKIIELKVGNGVNYEEIVKATEEEAKKEDSESTEEIEVHTTPRFFRLNMIDDKYTSYSPTPYKNDDLTLSDICEEFRNFACSFSHLYYDIKTIRLMFAGLSTTKLVLLQGISGTGKTSLPYCMGKYFENESTIASVQPSWKDRSELFGFYNEFTKKFNETEFLCRLYESSFEDNINIVILDELNIARVEYYFAEMLSILELPDHDSWKIQLVSNVWENDPVHLSDGKLVIPENVWYVGTANNDDSTYSVSDKVYDRAFIINLDKKGVPFDAPQTTSRKISYSYVDSLYNKACEEDPLNDAAIKKIEVLDNYVIEHFRIAFGNRIMKQMKIFVPVYKACGGTELEAIDYMLATKVFRKFESLNLVVIREEIKGLISQLNIVFGDDTMLESIAYLKRLQKSY